MIALKVTTDQVALSRKLKQSVASYPRKAAAGINRAAQGAYTLSVREIQADIGASSQKTIRTTLKLDKATGQKPEARLSGRSSKKDRIPIYELKPTPRAVTTRRPPGGVRYGAQRKLIPGSFIANVKAGDKGKHTGVFMRVGKKRLPIVERFGPSIARVFSRKKITDKIRVYLKDRVPKEIARAFKFAAG